ncbi:MAG: protease modulator HflC [Deltaproteobacteria bacterium]|nr:protease modulator HflC [Deltaproteobacteria bacterium]
MAKRIASVLLLALAVVGAVTSFVVVDERSHAVITQFGRPVSVLSDAGFYLKLPVPFQRASLLDKSILITNTRETELLTADKKNVLVSTYISWKIADPVRYLAALRTREFAENRLAALVQSELGSALGDRPFGTILGAAGNGASLAELEGSVEEAVAKVAGEDLGIEVVSLGVTRLIFPQQNLDSVFARMRAERARIARGHRSEGRAEAQKIAARAERERARIIADAEAEAAMLRGRGEAEAARIYAGAYEGHGEFYRFLRTLEAYKKVLNEKTTLVLPADSPFLDLLTSRIPSAGAGPGRDGKAAERKPEAPERAGAGRGAAPGESGRDTGS